MLVPTEPKLYHIVHVDRLASIVADGWLWCDAETTRRNSPGTAIGMSRIKQRRLGLALKSHPDLHVGECVPFYFCPRSVMLYVIHRRNSDLTYGGGQGPIVHLAVDLRRTAAWAKDNRRRWAFTTSSAGAFYFEDYSNLDDLDKIAWDAVGAGDWAEPPIKEGKQAEFLVQHSLPWRLVSHIGVCSGAIRDQVLKALKVSKHRPSVRVEPAWYY